MEVKFRFENWWMMESSLEGEIQNLWDHSTGYFFDNIENMKKGLVIWAKTVQSKRRILKKNLPKNWIKIEMMKI